MSNEKTTGPEAAPADRRSFLRRTFVTGTVAVPAVAAVTAATSNTAKAEIVQAELRVDFESIRQHENDHVAAILAALGNNARPRPNFQSLRRPTFPNFFRYARVLENTGVGAYLNAAPAIKAPGILAAAGSIALIEARHAGTLNYIDDEPFDLPITGNVLEPRVDHSFERALTVAEVQELAGPLIRDLNGGPPFTYDDDPANKSDANDIAILNFALVLEYLEAAFYNINVPRFYP